MKNTVLAGVALLLILAFSCKRGPKVIEEESVSTASENTSLFQDVPASPDQENLQERKVVAMEVLNTDRYTYIRVKEEGREFWIAVSLQEITTGQTYYFQRALLKQNFLSQEFNRVFETLYLVSDLRAQPLAEMTSTGNELFAETPASVEVTEPIKPSPGSVKISEIFGNPSKFDGKKIKVTGKCVKVNPMIMGRNWIHLQDGSGKNYDLTVTTMENIPLGAILTLEGTIALNKEFGAGYRYDIIMEGVILH